MGDVVSSHLDETKRDMITAQTGEVMDEVARLYRQQYAVALFNKLRFDIEGGGGPQPQLLHRKIPLENKSIFSGSIFQFQEDSKKWRNRFLLIPDDYNITVYESKSSYDKHSQPKGSINCAGYKVLTSLEQYLELVANSLPDVKAKVGSSPFLKCPSQFPLLLYHPYCKHHCFCVTTEKEQQKWLAVLQDCVRYANDGLSEDDKVQTPAFTDAVRLYRQRKGNYGTWEMMCGAPAQILSNLVMDDLHSELRDLISPRLKGKLHERQRNWILISDAVYSLVWGQCQSGYNALVEQCKDQQPALESSIRTDIDQIISSKEFITNKIRAVVLPKAEKLLKVSIEPYIGSILDALMEPTSRGFAEAREVFFRELVEMSKNTVNNGTKETVAQHMEKISMLAFHPVKMQSCYEKVEPLRLEGLQQRFDVSSPAVFVHRAQILMRDQMDDAVYTFEQILHQSLESQGTEELCKTIQRCQDRVIKKFDYDSSTVRKRFFREALLQIFIPYMLKQLSPSCVSELPNFQELIFEDFSRYILVENIFEEVVLHSVMKDIMMAVKEAAVQRRHNLYRDSIVLSNSDPSLHLLGENPSINWAGEYREELKEDVTNTSDLLDRDEDGESLRKRRMKQVVSMIQVEGSPIIPESCLEVPAVEDIPEDEELEFNSTKGKENVVEESTEPLTEEKQDNDEGLAKEEANAQTEPKQEAKQEQKDTSATEKTGQTEPEQEKKLNGDFDPTKVENLSVVEKLIEEPTVGSNAADLNKATKAAPDENQVTEITQQQTKEVPMNTEVVKEAISTQEVPTEDIKKSPDTAADDLLKTEETLVANVNCSTPKNEMDDEKAASSNLESSLDELLPPPPPPEEDSPEIVPIQGSSSDSEGPKEGSTDFPPVLHDDSGFQSPTSDATEDEDVGNAQHKTAN